MHELHGTGDSAHKVTKNHYLIQISFLHDFDAEAVQEVVLSVGYSFRA